ncbi:ABC transporter substrate-binding protein [Litoricolaceae bacterium]|jgi:4,5-dihydroxyphthalate decarboxylase|nr:ABC transporter substrate-binding protein [Litorivicinaceae bacterium]MDA8704427.1 ABC transporter substrate-binding protein [Litorivicinaceae bacterium]MDB2620036.1 ABC transporter substrate-binding protein [Litorivicinaceae bacterium]
MSKLNLTIATGNYDRTRPISDGRVNIEGVDPNHLFFSPEEMFYRAFRFQSFDVCELSFSSYCVGACNPDFPYIAVPVFLSRAFRHAAIFTRNDASIDKPSDLKGKTLGVTEYQLTANVWLRGILEDYYGVPQTDIHWIRGGLFDPKRPEKIKVQLPSNLDYREAPEGSTLNELMASGKIDGLIGPRPPKDFYTNPNYGRLFPDTYGAVAEYYQNTQIFPIMHVLGIKKELVSQYPWLPASLYKAFEEARKVALDAILDTSASKMTMPLLDEQIDFVRKELGAELWTYGFNNNRHVIDKFLDYHYQQGLSSRRLEAEELFHPSSMESYSL